MQLIIRAPLLVISTICLCFLTLVRIPSILAYSLSDLPSEIHSTQDNSNTSRSLFSSSNSNETDFSIALSAQDASLPGAPRSVFLREAHLSNTLELFYQTPWDDGGKQISKYLIECDSSSQFNASFESDYWRDEISIQYEVQEIILECGESCTGLFYLEWGGKRSSPLDVDASANAMQTAVVEILGSTDVNQRHIHVTKTNLALGPKWVVTFNGVVGNIGEMNVDYELVGGADPVILVNQVRPGMADIYPSSFTHEIQSITLKRKEGFSTVLGGNFKLSFEGVETQSIGVDISALDMKEILEELETINTVNVEKEEDGVLVTWSVTFTNTGHEESSGSGDLEMIHLSSSSFIEPESMIVDIFEKRRGTDPFVYSLGDLQQGKERFCKVSSYNAVGYGQPSRVVKGTPIGKPWQLISPFGIVGDKKVDVSWIDETETWDMKGYHVEWYSGYQVPEIQQITTSASSGVSEVQIVRTTADNDSLTGFFTLSLGGEITQPISVHAAANGQGSVADKLKRLSTVGDVTVSRKPSKQAIAVELFSVTSGSNVLSRQGATDLTTLFKVGDRIFVDGTEFDVALVSTASITLSSNYNGPSANGIRVYRWAYGFEWEIEFTSHVGPINLIQALPGENWGGVNPSIRVLRLRKGRSSLSGTFEISLFGKKSHALEHDADASQIKDALEAINEIGEVAVSVHTNNNGKNFMITFLSYMGNVPLIEVDSSNLRGGSAKAKVSVVQEGILPENFDSAFISSGSSYTIDNLQNGVVYKILVFAENSKGIGQFDSTRALYASPIGLPLSPTNVQLIVMSDRMIKVVWEEPIDLGGVEFIEYYQIQWDTTSDFANANDVNVFVSENQGPVFCRNIEVDAASRQGPIYVQVIASNEFGWSFPQKSLPESVSLMLLPPGGVENAKATITGSNGIMAEWQFPNSEKCTFGGDGGSMVTHFVLEWDDNGEFSSPNSVLLASDRDSFHIGGRDPITGAESDILDYGGTYYLRITTFNANGSGSPINFQISDTTRIGPLVDTVPTAPVLQNIEPLDAETLSVEWETPLLDGGAAIETYAIEYSANPEFEHAIDVEIPVIREVQTFGLATESLVNEVQVLEATVEVTNEIQSVRTIVAGVDEIQTVTLTSDDVIAEVQTLYLTALDSDEIQSIFPVADDIDEIQQIRVSGDDLPEIQVAKVTVPRQSEVQKLGIVISNINTNGDDSMGFGCYNVNVGEACQEIEDSISGSFTLSFEFDKCGGENNANYCQSALTQYDPDLGMIECTPGLVSDPVTGGDHCVSAQVHQIFTSIEGDVGTLQWALNGMLDDNGKSFMTSNKTPTKAAAVTVSRQGQIKTKGGCTENSDGIAECSGEYEISYSITFDSDHSSGDVPPLTIVHSNVKVDISSTQYTNFLCPSSSFSSGCIPPEGTALDSMHGNFYEGSTHDEAFEFIKGSQPDGMISLVYECESKTTKMNPSYTMTASADGLEVSFDDTTFLSNAKKGHWLRYTDGDGNDVYRKIQDINILESKLSLFESVIPSMTSSDVEYGLFFSDWSESNGMSGVSNECQHERFHETLPISINTNQQEISSSDWKQKLNALTPIDSTGIVVSRKLSNNLSLNVGFEWEITFQKQPGLVNLMTCLDDNLNAGTCTIGRVQASSIIDGEFALGTTWPHEYLAESPGLFISEQMSWNVESENMKTLLESIKDGLDQVFGSLAITREPYVPVTDQRWSGGYTWTITFLNRPGNVPAMSLDGSNLSGSSILLEVSDEDSGLSDLYRGLANSASFVDDPGIARDGNQVSGSFALSWLGNSIYNPTVTANVFPIQKGGSEPDQFMALSQSDFQTILSQHIFGNNNGQVIVTRSNIPSQVMGFKYSIRFVHENVGGDVHVLNYVQTPSLLGTNAGVVITEEAQGNEIKGTFQLKFQGQLTRPINHDATANDVESALNELSSILPSRVTVSRSNEPLRTGPSSGMGGLSTQVGGYVWSITFASNAWKDPTAVRSLTDVPGNWYGDPVGPRDEWGSGFSKGWGKNVGDMPLMECISSGLTTTNGMFPTDGCVIEEKIKGTEPLAGSFKLCLDTSEPTYTDDVISVKGNYCTDNIRYDAPASAVESGGDGSSVEEKLEALSNIGDVFVTRGDVDVNNGGYTWTIEFLHDVDGPCQIKGKYSGLCNAAGNVPKLCSGSNMSTCEDSALLGTCKRPGMCSKLTVLDMTDFMNGERPPARVKRVIMTVQDPLYQGWNDGTVVSSAGINAQYKLNIDGITTNCLNHDSSAQTVQDEIQAILDVTGMGKVRVERKLSEIDAPNGFLFFIYFYETGNSISIAAEFSNDSSICSNGFATGQSVSIAIENEGELHPNTCATCADGIIQRSDFTVFEVMGDSLNGSLAWNADAMLVKSHLEQVSGRNVNVERILIDKFGSTEWRITFTGNPGVIPPGASDVQPLQVTQGPDSAGRMSSVIITEIEKGSESLGGKFTIDFGSPQGPIEVDYDEPAKRLELKLNDLNVIGRVYVTRDCYPSCTKGGWGNLPVTDEDRLGGLMWHIYFLDNPGTTNGKTFPPGSGNVDLPITESTQLLGYRAVAYSGTTQEGSSQLEGSFYLKHLDEISAPLPFNANSETIEQSIKTLAKGGSVSVKAFHSYTEEIPGITVSTERDGHKINLVGDDIRKHLLPGDLFQLIDDDLPFAPELGGAQIIAESESLFGSPILSINPDGIVSPPSIGEKILFGGEEYDILRNGSETQQIVMHNGSVGGHDFYFTLSLTVDGVTESTQCIQFGASSEELELELNSLSNTGENNVEVSSRQGTSGNAGDAHVFKVIFDAVLGNVGEINVGACADPTKTILPYSHVKSLVHGGKVEHQKIILSADSGTVDPVPSFSLTISNNAMDQVSTPCIEWGAETLNLSPDLEGSFASQIFLVGSNGIVDNGNGLYTIHAAEFVEGSVSKGDQIQIASSCAGEVQNIGSDGKSLEIKSTTPCVANTGTAVSFLPDTGILEYSSGRKVPKSHITELTLTSQELVEDDTTGFFKLQLTFRNQIYNTQCLPYGISEEDLQKELNSLFDLNGDNVVDSNDGIHIHVSRDGDGLRGSSFGYKYIIESKGSDSVSGISNVVGTTAPLINIFGSGSTVGCVDYQGEEIAITSLASTTSGSATVTNVDLTQQSLHTGSRIKLDTSLDHSKVYTVATVDPDLAIITLEEPFLGTTVSATAKIIKVSDKIPLVETKLIQGPRNEYEYDVYFVGHYWEDVPIMTINKFGDGTCEGSVTDISGGMNRNMDIVTVQNGGGSSSFEHVLDKIVLRSGPESVFLVPQTFRVKQMQAMKLEITIKDEQFPIWSSGNPSFKLIKNGVETICLDRNIHPRDFEGAMSVFCKEGNGECVSVIKKIDHLKAPNGHVYVISFHNDIDSFGTFSIDFAAPGCNAFNIIDGETAELSGDTEIMSSTSPSMSDTSILLGLDTDASKEAQWRGSGRSTLKLYKLSGTFWKIRFKNYLGNVPALELTTNLSSGLANTFVRDNVAIDSSFNTAAISKLKTGIPYYIRMVAMNAVGKSDFSNVVTGIPSERALPTKLSAQYSLNQNEIQSITISATHISEIQKVTTNAKSIPEVQEVRVDGQMSNGIHNGSFSLRFPEKQHVLFKSSTPILAGSFFLHYKYMDLNDSILQADGNFVTKVVKSPCIPYGSSAEIVQRALEDDALENGLPTGSVTVILQGENDSLSDNRYEYIISFNGSSVRGNVEELTTDSSLSGLDAVGGASCQSFDSLSKDVTVEIKTINDGDALGTDTSHAVFSVNADGRVASGSFALSVTHLGQTLETDCLPWDSEATVVENALKSLSNVDSARVRRRGSGFLSMEQNSIQDMIDAVFVKGESSNVIEISPENEAVMNEILNIGDRVSFPYVGVNGNIYNVVNISGRSATLDGAIPTPTGPFSAVLHHNYEFSVHFDGQGMHPSSSIQSPFKPSLHFGVSTSNCDPMQTFIDRMMVPYTDESGMSAAVSIKSSFDGGDVLVSNDNDASQEIGKSLANSMPMISGSFYALQSLILGDSSIIYTFTFNEKDGNLDELVCNMDTTLASNSGNCEVFTIMDGNVLSGVFFLGPSAPIPFDASSSEMKQILESLPTITNVDVSRKHLSHKGNYEWMITFVGDNGDVDLLPALNSLIGKDASIQVEEYRKGNEVGGTFVLGYDGDFTSAISSTASAAEVREALESLEAFNHLLVSESDPNPEGGKTLKVTFLDYGLGDIEDLVKDTSSLSGIGANVFIQEDVKGAIASSNTLQLSFPSPSHCSISQVKEGVCGSSVSMIRFEVDSLNNSDDSAMHQVYIPDRQIQIVQTQGPKIDGVYQVTKGSFQLEYNGATTTSLSYDCNELEMRIALESLPTIETVGVTKNLGATLIPNVFVELKRGSSLVRCHSSCVCDFQALGLRGNDLILIENQWYRVSSSYAGSQEEFHVASHANSLDIVQFHEDVDITNVYTWNGGYDWKVSFQSWIGDLGLLQSPLHALRPNDSSLGIKFKDCNKCISIHGLEEWSNYSIRMQVYNYVGTSIYSNPVHAATKSLPQPPTNIVFDVFSGSCVQISMNPPELYRVGNEEENLSMIIEWDTFSDFRSNQTPVQTCASSSNGHCEIYVTETTAPFEHLLCNLLPSTPYFFRIASKNSVEIQKIFTSEGEVQNLNWSSTYTISLEDQVPENPTLLSAVALSLEEVQVVIDPPIRNGGQPLNSYSLHVNNEWAEHVASIVIDIVDMKPIIGSSSLIQNLATDKLGMSPWKTYSIELVATNIVGDSQKSDPIQVRITSPPESSISATLSTPKVGQSPITSATVTWSGDTIDEAEIDGYLVEWWSEDKKPEIQIVKMIYEAPLVDTKFSLTYTSKPDVKATTALMPWDAGEDLIRRELMNLGWDEDDNQILIENVQVSKEYFTNGHSWTITFGENEKGLNYGDEVALQGNLVSNGDSGVPVLTISTIQDGQRPHGQSEIQLLQIYGTGELNGFFQLMYDGQVTSFIPASASARDIKMALEQLPAIRDVAVSKNDSIDPSLNILTQNLISHYEITFVANDGDIASLSVDFMGAQTVNNDINIVIFEGNNIVNENGFKLSSAQPGEKPVAYSSSSLLNKSISSFEMTGLITGKEYFVSVSAMNHIHGYGPRILPSPESIIPPVQVPQPPENIMLDVNFGVSDSIKVSYDAPLSNGGDDISRYRIEIDPTPSFDNPIVQNEICPPYNKRTVWRVETKANDGAIISGGSFTLQLSGNGISRVSDEIPYNAVALAQNETGTTEWFNDIDFMVSDNSVFVMTSPATVMGGLLFEGDHVQFTGQSSTNKFYELAAVQGNTLTLSESYSGNSGPQKISRHYGGRGNPSTSRLYCEYDETLCTQETLKLGGSMQKKIQKLSDIINLGVAVDRDGPTSQNEFLWRITFLDNPPSGGSDFHLDVMSSSLSTVNGVGSASVVTTLMTDGEPDQDCIGTKVVPRYGGLVKGLEYYVRVFAVNSEGYSTEVKAGKAQAPIVVPGPPTSVSLDVVSSTELRVMFAPPVDNGGAVITKYLIEWSTNSAFENVGSSTVEYLLGGSPFFKTIDGLVTGSKYYVRVKAGNSQGYGKGQASSPPFLNPHMEPNAPAEVNLGITSDSMLSVGWTPPINDGGDTIRSYRIEWDTKAAFTSTNMMPQKGFVDVDGEERSHTIEMLSPAKVYFVRVFAYNTKGSSLPTISEPLFASPKTQVPGIVTGFVVYTASSGESGAIDVHWQPPLIPHHGIPCATSMGSPLVCPTKFGGGVPQSNGGEPIKEFEIEWNERSDFEGSDGGRKVVYGSSITFTRVENLTVGREYFVRVLARNIVGSGSFTEPQSILVL